ncbi:interleukin-1 receptor type 2 [Tiliqua scincoides]|uniref:interleukin-1 receptor type 2 n=1 Tax=Tiliqua scincoides TaxID=71010 RepID=UPI0034618E2B
MVHGFLWILSANILDVSALRIQRGENAGNCQDHSVHFRTTYVLAGEALILKCPPFRYKHKDTFDLLPNITWYKENGTTMISLGHGERRILPQGDALWFLPASLEDSGQYVCIRRNSSYCADVSLNLTVVKKSAAHETFFPQTAVMSSPGKVICPHLGSFIQKGTDYELKWYKDSTPLTIDNEKYKAWKGRNYVIISSLTSDDAGYYTCQMSLEHEAVQYNITRTILLQIFARKIRTSPVIVYPNQKTTLAVLGSRLTIPCKVWIGASSHSDTEVWWKANNSYIGATFQKGRIMQGKQQELVESDENYIEVPLIFDPVKEEDFQTHFTCVASNIHGHHVHAVQVDQEETEPRLSWYLALIPVALTVVIVGGICIHKHWKQRSPRGYAAAKS